MPPFELEFYEDATGDIPVLRWLREELPARKRRALGAAMNNVLQRLGVGVCGTEYGRPLGHGLFEFRLRGAEVSRAVPGPAGRDPAEAKILLRVFCHAHGERLVLLLGAYDKGTDPSPRRQAREIAVARQRLRDWRRRNVPSAG